jgi:hypothetical protein
MAPKILDALIYKPTRKLYDTETSFNIQYRYNPITQSLTMSHVRVLFKTSWDYIQTRNAKKFLLRVCSFEEVTLFPFNIIAS